MADFADNPRHPARTSLLSLCLAALVLPVAAAEVPAAQTDSLEFTTAGRSTLTEAGHVIGRQTDYSLSASWLQRQALPFKDWYWGAGVSADVYEFSGSNTLGLNRLQDCAAQLSLEYFIAGEPVVSVIARPGFYFESHPTGADWDIPVEAITGVPLTGSFSGVLGLLDARFYRRLVPVAGIIWTITPQVRLEAVYPEPALVITCARQLELRLGGELDGAGFRTDAALAHRPVDYTSYRVGVTLSGKPARHFKLTGAAGCEVERTFEFLHETRRVHGGSIPYVKLNLEYAL